jgi:ABC-type nitrate/sulfonate/bicarbonate transport system permease component
MAPERIRRGAMVAAIAGGLLVAWEIIEALVDRARVAQGLTTLTVLVPTPTAIAHATVENFWLMQDAMLHTLRKAGLGFALGVIVATVVAMVYALSGSLRAATLPLAYAFNSFPIMGLVPAIVLAFGQDNVVSIAVIAMILSYFPVLIALDTAFARTSAEFLELGRIYNANRWQMLRYIQIPAAIPALFVGLRLAAPASIVGATVGELLGSRNGVGNIVAVALYQLQPDLMYAMLIEVAVVSALVALVVTLVEKRATHWLP